MAHSSRKKTDKNHTDTPQKNVAKTSFIKRIGAYFIDLILVLSLLIGATVIALLIVYLGKIIGLIHTNGNASHYLANSLVFAGYLATVTVTFYSYYWVKIGQTLGMRVFNLRIQNSDGSNISVTQSLIRITTSVLGLGNLIAIFSPYQSFQDSWAECEMIDLTPNK
jgi:uncharacterized RDD family membrane protein YckC